MPRIRKSCPVGVKFGINIAPTICTAKALKQISRNCSLPAAHRFQIVLKITERDMLKEQEATQLSSLLHSSVGVEIAIDDFGTGHSALSILPAFYARLSEN